MTLGQVCWVKHLFSNKYGVWTSKIKPLTRVGTTVATYLIFVSSHKGRHQRGEGNWTPSGFELSLSDVSLFDVIDCRGRRESWQAMDRVKPTWAVNEVCSGCEGRHQRGEGNWTPSGFELPDVSLSDVSLSDVSLSDVSLSEISLSNVRLSDVTLSDVSLSEISLSNVRLSDVTLSYVSLSDVCFLKSVCLIFVLAMNVVSSCGQSCGQFMWSDWWVEISANEVSDWWWWLGDWVDSVSSVTMLVNYPRAIDCTAALLYWPTTGCDWTGYPARFGLVTHAGDRNGAVRRICSMCPGP
ncbi:hypothetical protein Btru_024360 [Bulinus truncatus]|nr:hypothetical protein Btru_024360 [Bulinus truncatus]